MNRRGEWGQNLPPKLEVTDTDDDWQPNSNHNPEKVKRKARGQGPSQEKVKVNPDKPSQVKKKRRVEIPTNAQTEAYRVGTTAGRNKRELGQQNQNSRRGR